MTQPVCAKDVGVWFKIVILRMRMRKRMTGEVTIDSLQEQQAQEVCSQGSNWLVVGQVGWGL